MAAAANSATSAACTAARSDEDEPNFVQEDGLLSDSQVSVAVYVRAAVGSLRAVATDSESVPAPSARLHRRCSTE